MKESTQKVAELAALIRADDFSWMIDPNVRVTQGGEYEYRPEDGWSHTVTLDEGKLVSYLEADAFKEKIGTLCHCEESHPLALIEQTGKNLTITLPISSHLFGREISAWAACLKGAVLFANNEIEIDSLAEILKEGGIQITKEGTSLIFTAPRAVSREEHIYNPHSVEQQIRSNEQISSWRHHPLAPVDFRVQAQALSNVQREQLLPLCPVEPVGDEVVADRSRIGFTGNKGYLQFEHIVRDPMTGKSYDLRWHTNTSPKLQERDPNWVCKRAGSASQLRYGASTSSKAKEALKGSDAEYLFSVDAQREAKLLVSYRTPLVVEGKKFVYKETKKEVLGEYIAVSLKDDAKVFTHYRIDLERFKNGKGEVRYIPGDKFAASVDPDGLCWIPATLRLEAIANKSATPLQSFILECLHHASVPLSRVTNVTEASSARIFGVKVGSNVDDPERLVLRDATDKDETPVTLEIRNEECLIPEFEWARILKKGEIGKLSGPEEAVLFGAQKISSGADGGLPYVSFVPGPELLQYLSNQYGVKAAISKDEKESNFFLYSEDSNQSIRFSLRTVEKKVPGGENLVESTGELTTDVLSLGASIRECSERLKSGEGTSFDEVILKIFARDLVEDLPKEDQPSTDSPEAPVDDLSRTIEDRVPEGASRGRGGFRLRRFGAFMGATVAFSALWSSALGQSKEPHTGDLPTKPPVGRKISFSEDKKGEGFTIELPFEFAPEFDRGTQGTTPILTSEDIEKLRAYLNENLKDGRILAIKVHGFASPEGGTSGSVEPGHIEQDNERVAKVRAQNALKTLVAEMKKANLPIDQLHDLVSVSGSEQQLTDAEWKKLKEIAKKVLGHNDPHTIENIIERYNAGTLRNKELHSALDSMLAAKRRVEISIKVEMVPKNAGLLELPVLLGLFGLGRLMTGLGRRNGGSDDGELKVLEKLLTGGSKFTEEHEERLLMLLQGMKSVSLESRVAMAHIALARDETEVVNTAFRALSSVDTNIDRIITGALTYDSDTFSVLASAGHLVNIDLHLGVRRCLELAQSRDEQISSGAIEILASISNDAFRKLTRENADGIVDALSRDPSFEERHQELESLALRMRIPNRLNYFQRRKLSNDLYTIDLAKTVLFGESVVTAGSNSTRAEALGTLSMVNYRVAAAIAAGVICSNDRELRREARSVLDRKVDGQIVSMLGEAWGRDPKRGL